MKKVGLSLGGGALRGAAHVGVIKELTRRGIKITHVAGTSSGAVVAGLYACGLNPKELENVVDDFSIFQLLDFGIGRRGLFKGDHAYRQLLELTQGKHFSDLEIPLAVVCVDLNSGNLSVVRSGEVATALRASIAIPGIFRPVEMGDQLLVDGYILNNNPADVVKQMGAKSVVAVQIGAVRPGTSTNMFSLLRRYLGIASSHMTSGMLEENADLLININLNQFERLSSRKLSRLVRRGELETRRVMDGVGEQLPWAEAGPANADIIFPGLRTI